MQLTTEQIKIFDAELTKRGGLNPCILCGGKAVSIGSYVFELRSYTAEKTVEADMPLVPVVCEKCGHTALINVKVLENRRIDDIAAGVGVFIKFP